MANRRTTLTVTDQFCGAGGSSIGATRAGAELRLALNHWDLAIETHNANFPDADHDCTDISACNPRRYPSTDILITSPECTNHTLAKGVARRRQAQLSLLGGEPDPAAERSRATMWDVPRFAEHHGYQAVIVENVVEARWWVMWDAWLHAMQLLGYAHQCVYMNSMHAHPTPQSRDRMYVVFWRNGNRAPDLAITARAYCTRCGHDVEGRQTWRPGRHAGRYGRQYDYTCPECLRVVVPYYYAAANAIDWSLPTPRIADRARPLRDRTLDRIRAGLRRFGAQPQVAPLKDVLVPRPVTEPLTTLVASASQHALVTPPVPFLTSYYGSGQNASVTDPMGTVTTRDRHALVVPPFILSAYTRPTGQGAALSSLDAALPTLPGRAVHSLVVPPPFLLELAHRGGMPPRDVSDPLMTQTTAQSVGLVVPDRTPEPEECGFRMLRAHECKRGMAFPDDYIVRGTERDQIKQYGNAVTPPVMQLLVGRVVASLQ